MPDDTGNAKRSRRGGQRPRKGHQGPPQTPKTSENAKSTLAEQDSLIATGEENKDDDLEEDMCHICAELMEKKSYAVAECNHRTCHACALRLRALYKKLECTFCKKPQSLLIITSSKDRLFESYAPEDTPFHDTKLAIDFETQEMMEDCLILLRFNCPDVSCDYVAGGWPELKHHTRTAHGLLLCNLCLRHKKIFAHEHTLYTPQQLSIHLPTARTFGSKHASTSANSDIDVHPVCEFCDEALYGEDEHFAHMRQRHEECFVCKAGGIQHQYFQNYNSLERHFQTVHHPCPHPECIAQKFVVFPTPLDLKAHVLEKHGEAMSSRDLRDLRRVQADFASPDATRTAPRQHRPQPVSQPSTDRDLPVATSSPSGSVSQASRRQQAFSGSLSNNDTTATTSRPTGTSGTAQEGHPPPTQQETAFISRLSAATHGSPTAVPAMKAAIHAYRTSESNARDLIDTLFTILGQELDATTSFIPSLASILNDEKRADLLAMWSKFKTDQEQQFPSLAPAPTTSQATANNKRAIQVKKLQANGSRRRVWDRVAQAASSTPITRQTATFATPSSHGSTPWSRSAAGPSNSTPTDSRSQTPLSSVRAQPPSIAAFPSLPPSAVSRPPKEFVSGQSSLRAIVGSPITANAWGGQDSSTQPADGEEVPQQSKKKKNTKQTLFTLGSMR